MKNKVVIIIVFFVLISVKQAAATVIFNSFGPNDEFFYGASKSVTTPNQGNPPSDNDLASAFVVPSNSDYILDTVSLALWYRTGSNELDLWIMGSRPSTNPIYINNPRIEPDSDNIIEYFHLSNEVSGSGIGGIVTADSISHPILKANTLYWTVISVSEPDSMMTWWWSPIVHPVWVGEKNDPYYNNMWETFEAADGGMVQRITANLVPEPSSMLLFGIGGLVMAVIKRKKR